MAGGLSKILARQYQKCVKEDHENILFFPKEDDLRVCYCLVVGLGYPYLGGEFLFEVTAPEEFPRKPPSVRCLTTNGVYSVGPRICISIGEYHSEDRADASAGSYGWRPVMGIIRFAQEMVNGLIVPGELNLRKHPDSGKGGIGIEDTSEATRVMLALSSHDYNVAANTKLRSQFWEKIASAGDTYYGLRAAKAWRRQIAQRAVSEPVLVRRFSYTSSEKFIAAFGNELWDWAGKAHPRCQELALMITTVVKLRQWDSLFLRKCCLLLEISRLGGDHHIIQDASWSRLTALLPVGKLPPPLSSMKDVHLALTTLHLGGRNVTLLIERWMFCVMSGDLKGRDDLFVSIATGKC